MVDNSLRGDAVQSMQVRFNVLQLFTLRQRILGLFELAFHTVEVLLELVFSGCQAVIHFRL